MFESMFDIVACGACTGLFGRWKTKLQNDDADLWLDLAFANHVPDVKPPPIPKVVSIVQDSEEEDVSTICGTAYYVPRRSQQHERSDARNSSHEEKRDEEQVSAMYGHSLELEIEKPKSRMSRNASRGDQSRTSSYADMDDASLESIMGPRSCRSAASSRPPPVSWVKQQRKEQYQRFVDSFSRSFHLSEEHKESFEDDDGSSYGSISRKLSLYLKRKEGLDTAVSLHKASSMPPTVWSARTSSVSTSTRTRSTLTLRTQDKTCRATNVRGGGRMRSVEI